MWQWVVLVVQGTKILGVIQEHEIGKSSPSAFVPYDHEGKPDPKYFSGILANSLNKAEAGLCGIASAKGSQEASSVSNWSR